MGRGKRNRERTEFWTWVRTASSSATFHEELPTARIGVDRTLKNLARKTCRPRDSCFRVNRGSEGERDRANLSCFWHFLSSMNHAAEKIFCPSPEQRAKPTTAVVPRPTSVVVQRCSWSSRSNFDQSSHCSCSGQNNFSAIPPSPQSPTSISLSLADNDGAAAAATVNGSVK